MKGTKCSEEVSINWTRSRPVTGEGVDTDFLFLLDVVVISSGGWLYLFEDWDLLEWCSFDDLEDGRTLVDEASDADASEEDDSDLPLLLLSEEVAKLEISDCSVVCDGSTFFWTLGVALMDLFFDGATFFWTWGVALMALCVAGAIVVWTWGGSLVLSWEEQPRQNEFGCSFCLIRHWFDNLIFCVPDGLYTKHHVRLHLLQTSRLICGFFGSSMIKVYDYV